MTKPAKIVQRFLYPCGRDDWLDADGLRIDNGGFLNHKTFMGMTDFSQLPGAILLAEGGMGKTTFMRMLKDELSVGKSHWCELGEFAGDPRGLQQDLDIYLKSVSPGANCNLFFDGLDEAPGLAGVILRQLRGLPDKTSIWIASRDVAAIRSIQEEQPQLEAYNLAPLSEKDIRELASHAGVNEDYFLQAVHRQGMVGICAKPLGCELVISLFRENGLTGVNQRDLWHQGIERLCDETPTTTRRLSSPSPHTLDQIVGCAAWIALCVVLTEDTFVWADEQSHCPTRCIGLSDLVSGEFPPGLIRSTLKRGVFTPLGDGRTRFAHPIYRDYLAAFGLSKYIPSVHWPVLLLNADRSGVFPQRAGIATWLAAFNKDFLDELSGIQPELLLSSVDAVQAIGPTELCTSLLKRAEKISYQQRRSVIAKNLSRLASTGTSTVIRERLLDSQASVPEIEFAIDIAVACECTELSDVLVDRVLDTTLELRQRVVASRAVFQLEDESSQRRLKSLLPIDPVQDIDDELRGIVLRCCWPEHLTPSELVDHLLPPQNTNLSGSYCYFLAFDLPRSLESAIDEHGAPALLRWSLDHLTENDLYDRLGQLARAIYTICWRWAMIPGIANMLAEGYIKTIKEFRSPFLEERYSGDSKGSVVLSREEFLRDVKRRFAVLDTICSGLAIKNGELSHIPFNDYPIYTHCDAAPLLERALVDPTGPSAECWATCIKAIIYQSDLDQHTERIDRLHSLRPDLIDSFQQIRKEANEAAKRAEASNRKCQKEDADRRTKRESNQERIDEHIKNALRQPDPKPENFVELASLLWSEGGKPSIGAIDVRQSPGWEKLAEAERDAMALLAESYLLEGIIEPITPNEIRFAVAQALTLLRLLKPGIYQGLDEQVWHRCSVELLKAVISDNFDVLGPLFDTLSEFFPIVAKDALIVVLLQELSNGHISITRHWGTRLTDEQAETILQIANNQETDSKSSYIIMKELVRCGKDGLVRIYLDTLFVNGWALPPDPEYHAHRQLAFSLSPRSYVHQILAAIEGDRVWGREWLETAVMSSEYGFQTALISCDLDVITSAYIWLHAKYPVDTRPEHERSGWLEALDKIYSLKTHIINHLTQGGRDGSAVALEKILLQFPGDTWLNNCILDAKSAEQANSVFKVSIAEIKEMSDERNATRRMVKSIQDLQAVVLKRLKDYQEYLQGDTRAIGDLWNTVEPIRPKLEEDLSDHLSRYLKLRLTNEAFINREVQIRRKLFKDGKSGSRTDIWIQTFDSNSGEALTLCIEVKCNWNPSAKTALKSQLIDKYMSGGTAEGGILLLGWFACSSWDDSDDKYRRSTGTWPNIFAAQQDLEHQADIERKAGNEVSAIVIDCGLT